MTYPAVVYTVNLIPILIPQIKLCIIKIKSVVIEMNVL